MSVSDTFSSANSAWGIIDPNPLCYSILCEPALTSELERLSAATSIGTTDCITLQPCLNPAKSNQDRYVVQDWELPGGKWQFTAVFDGHGGETTVNYVAEALSPLIQTVLESALINANGNALAPAIVSDILARTIADFDEAILRDFLDLFPGGVEEIHALSTDNISAIINDFESGGANHTKVMRSMQGSTVLASLVDPVGENLWVASLGDCQAVLGTRTSSGAWTSTLLSSNHNGNNNAEVARIRKEHPGEHDQCVMDDRVLGVIAVTRAIGDHILNLPSIYTDRIFLCAHSGHQSTGIKELMSRNRTPPYLSNQADVRHVNLKHLGNANRFLIMCSDGLVDLYMKEETRAAPLEILVDQWVSTVASCTGDDNKALRLLRDALGGDEANVSRMLTRESTTRWVDDTTILVQRL